MGQFSLITNLALGDLKYPLHNRDSPSCHRHCSNFKLDPKAEDRLKATNEAAKSSKYCPIPLPKSAQSDDQYANQVILTKAVAIVRQIQSQGSSELWCEMRNVTLTSSRFHHVLHHKGITPEFVESLFAERKLSWVAAVHQGRVHEAVATADYLTSR